MLSTPYFESAPEEVLGWEANVETREPRQLVEAEVRADCFDEEPFDDTFRIVKIREAVSYPGTTENPSSRNYPRDLVSIVDGEHLTLLSTGELHEALDEDDDTGHLLQHRMKLADPNLTGPQRRALAKHAATHVRNRKRKAKAVQEALGGGRDRFQLPGAGGGRVAAGVKPPVKSAIIPQDDPQTEERKKTGGQMSAQAFESFGRSLKRVGWRY